MRRRTWFFMRLLQCQATISLGTLPRHIGLSSSRESAFGSSISRLVFTSRDFCGFRSTASERPMPCLWICSQSSCNSSLVPSKAMVSVLADYPYYTGYCFGGQSAVAGGRQ